jgi:hypothetical protein
MATIREKSIQITNEDLLQNKYDIEIIKNNFDHLDMRTILHTQHLDVAFCVDYLLNDAYICDVEDDYYFSVNRILRFQKHITEHHIMQYIRSKNKK